MKSDVREAEVLKACLEFLRWKGIFCWRVNNIPVANPNGGYRKFRGLRGVADIQGVLSGGRAFHCEVKRPGGKLSPDQKVFLHRVDSLGGVALCVSSVNELEKDLKELKII